MELITFYEESVPGSKRPPFQSWLSHYLCDLAQIMSVVSGASLCASVEYMRHCALVLSITAGRTLSWGCCCGQDDSVRCQPVLLRWLSDSFRGSGLNLPIDLC